MKNNAFTILELVIVLSILGILIGIAIPRIKGMQQSGQIAQAQKEVQTLQAALESYYTFTHTYPPTSASLVTSFLSHATPQIVATPLIDPFSTPSAEYTYVLLSGGQYYLLASNFGVNAGVFNNLSLIGGVLYTCGATISIYATNVTSVVIPVNGTYCS